MTINLAKRREVMERSMRLGHCICEPRRPCPCDVFRDQGICPCAGERPEPSTLSEVKLTKLVRHPGCASKIAPADLSDVLNRLPPVTDSAVISGLAAADDAAIYRISDSLCLVQTVDVFTPCVDDPHLFGRICAANCLSDIYAMGGEPRTALSILAFPSETLHGEIMHQMLAGAMETLGRAGVSLIGGHSIKDEEIKLGFAITGTIDPSAAESLDAPCAGDALVLTKPLGTGVLSFAQQIDRADERGLAAAAQSMATLNNTAAQAMREAGASGCTDITGFGLFAHLLRMLQRHSVCAEVFAESLPAFDGVMELLRAGVIPGAIERNRDFVGNDLNVDADVDPACVNLGFDAQTSGGLLIAISRDRLPRLLANLEKRGGPAWVIGRITEPFTSRIVLKASAAAAVELPRTNPFNSGSAQEIMNRAPSSQSHPPGCCADVFDKQTAGSVAESQKAFGALMRSVQAPGALDEKTKELILFSLVVYSRCSPCFEVHRKQAEKMGITLAELEEAAWCAIAMGGAPVKMFYQESMEKPGQ